MLAQGYEGGETSRDLAERRGIPGKQEKGGRVERFLKRKEANLLAMKELKSNAKEEKAAKAVADNSAATP
jgi:hypothetical protein